MKVHFKGKVREMMLLLLFSPLQSGSLSECRRATRLGSCFARVYTRTNSQSFSFFAVTSVTGEGCKTRFTAPPL